MIFIRRFKTKNRKVFFLYTFVVGILIIVGFTFRYVFHLRENYLLVVRIYNVLEYCLLTWLFYLYISSKAIKKIIVASAVLFVLFCFFDYLKAPRPTLPFAPLIIEYLTLLIFIVYYFFEVLQENVIEPIYTKSIFWISVGFILNFSGNFFLFLYSNNSFNNEEFQRQYTIIYSSVTLLKNLMLCISVTINEPLNVKAIDDSFINESLDTNLPFQTPNNSNP